MKAISVALDAAFASGDYGLATCLKMTRRDGVIMAATTHDQDLVFDGVTYLARSGGTMSDLEAAAALAVNNAEMTGLLNLVSITETDLRAGLYDYATISVFEVNWRDLTQGKLSVLDGWLGQVTTKRNTFVAELRGLTQALSRTEGRLCSPLCSAKLGDARCGVDLGGADGGSPPNLFTVTGTLTGVSLDNATMFDTARAEPGPAGGISISGISNANPGVMTLASALSLPDGSGITLSGILGPTALNGVTIVRNRSADGLTFDLGIDTSDTAVYPAYAGGGVVTPAGAESGWFDCGLFTATSGLCLGLSCEVKTYVPGQWTLQLPMPYAMAIGDTYSMITGCNKTITTCHEKFDNHLRNRSRPYVPGQDKVVQIGRHT